MNLVWLSSALPADRAELAASLPPDFALVPENSSADPHDPADVGVLPVGSLCVATVFETELLARLEHRPAGVGLLVIGPTAGAGVTQASSIAELATAIRHAAAAPFGAAPFPAPPLTADRAAFAVTQSTSATSTATGTSTGTARTPLRTRLIAAGAVVLGLAVGGIVIGTTEGTSSATANGGGFGGGTFGGIPGGGRIPGGTGTVPGGGAAGTVPGGGTGTFQQELLTCLRKQGVTGSVNQLRQNANDPKLRQAFETCVQQLSAGSSQITGRP